MHEITHIRKVTPANFATVLAKLTTNQKQIPTETGYFLSDMARETGPRGLTPYTVTISGTWYGPQGGVYLALADLIRFGLTPLDSERTEITTQCEESVPVLAYFESELMPEIERRWPAEGKPAQQPAAGDKPINWPPDWQVMSSDAPMSASAVKTDTGATFTALPGIHTPQPPPGSELASVELDPLEAEAERRIKARGETVTPKRLTTEKETIQIERLGKVNPEVAAQRLSMPVDTVRRRMGKKK